MTFEQLAAKLPNGFHDAAIKEINLDFVRSSIAIDIELLVGVPTDPDPERYRTGTVKITRLYLFWIDPPDPRYTFIPDSFPLNASGSSVKPRQDPKVDSLLAVLPRDATTYSFFLDDWNSCLYVAGGSVEFSWDNGEILS